MKLCLISHTNFRGNSAMHVFNVAKELQALGHECCILVPDSPETVHEHGEPTFEVMDYVEALDNRRMFKNGGAPDLIHAWSPREHVREITQQLAVVRFGCPYVVHMEDNEEQIVQDELTGLDYSDLEPLPAQLIDELIKPYRSHPHRYRTFIEQAAGYSCLIDRLMEFKPEGQPGVVFWAGFEEAFSRIDKTARAARSRYGLSDKDIVILYSGNVHHSIVRDIQNLYLVVGLLRRRDYPVKLVRTGWDYADLELDERHGVDDYVINLGFVARAEVSVIVGMSDILVQPGRPDLFNDYRFPSKLPEYLVSGRPVVLPDSNIGTLLKDREQVLKLHDGSIQELMEAIVTLIKDADLCSRLGRNARAFALENLTWRKGVARLEGLYRQIAAMKSADRAKKESLVPQTPASGPERPTAAPQFPAKLIAFYLPQFHPIPENDEWWGKGFTEWTNVVRAPKNFRRHQQPRLPTEFGFYDLRIAQNLHEQANLARQYGIHGFCFYYYWFGGRRLLETPLHLWLTPQGPQFPFCICWANESWSRRWDGSETEVMMAQTYESGEHMRFIADVLPILEDPRYIRVDGAPMLLVYRVTDFGDSVGVAQDWRAFAKANGIERLHLCIVQSFGISDPRPYGFDAAIEFSPPHVGRMLIDPKRIEGVSPEFEGYLEDYISVAMRGINHPPTNYIRYRGLFPRWDNTARRKTRGHVFINDSAKAYGQWLRFLVREALYRRDQQEPLIFVNAWNEWAEGTYLEPDETYGRALLEVTLDAMCEGVIDHVHGPTPERERKFTEQIARLPKY